MKKRFVARRPSPAMLVAVIALVSSLTGGAVAATLIDTGDIKKGAVTKKKLHKNAVNSKKVKNKTLKAKDFADGQLEQGVQGIQGLQGEKGEKGDTGARGPSDLYSASRSAFVASPATISVDVPAGSYLVVAKVSPFNASGATSQGSCNIFAPDPTKADTAFTERVTNNFEGTPVALNAAIAPSDTTTVSLTCSGGGLTYGRMQLQVLQVETLH